ncbi:helix-turn-helix domain-containing protein [Burkholderia dolosa]|uniref:Helix-turn-helix transcriptional regulator n=1 Tax=Burkholderia dolosa TaxID=152500 RepID=A0A892IAS7_9BURK|nr:MULTISPECIES: helix-turn-helix transcriptional regulator [Burkholderia]AKE05923.1 XRE family transcriptional regulator [Burkholderia cepacia]AJY10514.1 helix-turn-helix family protein [Burkholderia dolosa AU0158]AYZ93746.1 XRE family transcriptional regulator [Burkholderia dolosa]ETP62531.1 XRE family transcriptional regulator [Burkholderia dolosa PC543]MBR8420686.1 helix-turn-helix transcriptional regulator [Burkholderia dolosa]
MGFPVQTLSQLRPILVGFRKSAGLTQAQLAARLGVTQQSYAQLEANPAAVSIERLFRVLTVLGVRLTLEPGTAADASTPDVEMARARDDGHGARVRSTSAPIGPPAVAKATKAAGATKAAAGARAAAAAAASARKRPAAAPRKSVRTKREDW